MTNKQLAREIQNFMSIRKEWIDRLVKNNEETLAAQHVISINSKIELLRSHWNWRDETIEMPYGYGKGR